MISTQSTPPIDIAANHALAMPAHVDHSHLVVEDLATVSQWYQRIMGLKPLETSASGETLGVGARPLLTLTTAGNVARAPRNAPGLFHTAFPRSEPSGTRTLARPCRP